MRTILTVYPFQEIGEIDESNVSDSSTITAAPMSVQTSRKAGRV